MRFRPFVWSVATTVALLLVVGAAGISLPSLIPAPEAESQLVQPFPADDQIFNEAGSAPEVANSLIEGGLSDGTVDAGGNRQNGVLFVDDDGADNIPGSVDDDLTLQSASPAVDAGNDTALPLDHRRGLEF